MNKHYHNSKLKQQLNTNSFQANTKATNTNQLTESNHQNHKPNTNGFTIIEVALVLAIAAMIFLVVFLAVPALQRNQRDDARKRDVSNVVAAIEAYYGNASNPMFTVGIQYDKGPKADSQLGSYLDTLSKNTDYVAIWGGVDAQFELSRSPNTTFSSPDAVSGENGPNINTVIVYTFARCNGSDKISKASANTVAVTVQLESGGNGKYYCQDAS